MSLSEEYSQNLLNQCLHSGMQLLCGLIGWKVIVLRVTGSSGGAAVVYRAY